AAGWFDGVDVDELVEAAVDGEAEQAVRAGAGGVGQGHAGAVAQHRARRRGHVRRRGQALLRPARRRRQAHRGRQGPLPRLQVPHPTLRRRRQLRGRQVSAS
uniref:Uncharacterized protein n=1 Tax=Oryza brachyantha TaxID=4533 RepID=J3L268_ORYBR